MSVTGLTPNTFTPHLQQLGLDKKLHKVFQKSVKIYLRCHQASEKICLHSKRLNILDTFLDQKKANVESEGEDRICVKYQNGFRVERGDHQVHIKFQGYIQEENATGFRKAPCGNGVIK
nr:unnamed protein product [Callosobruchus chinensis]